MPRSLSAYLHRKNRASPGHGIQVVGLVTLLGIGACNTWHVETAPLAQVLEERRPEVIRVTRGDDQKVPVYNPTVEGTSLRGLPTEQAITPISIPLREIQTVATKRFSLGKTFLVVLAAAGGAVLFELINTSNSTNTIQ